MVRKQIKTRHILIAVLCTAGMLVLTGIAGVGILIFVVTYPTNDRDNASPGKRKEMAAITLKWGRLAPFPPTANPDISHRSKKIAKLAA